jgi:hypothetical protein
MKSYDFIGNNFQEALDVLTRWKDVQQPEIIISVSIVGLSKGRYQLSIWYN